MSTQQAIIEDSFGEMGILNEETGLEPAELQRGLRELHKMIERWYDDGISIPYYLSSALTDDSGVDLSVEDALSTNLAIKLMAIYANDRQPSSALIALASGSKETLRGSKSSKPVRNHPRTLPRGTSGRWATNSNYPTFYSNKGQYRVLLSNNDPMYDGDGNPIYFDSETFS